MVNAAKIIPVILAGGIGTRLWPVSRTKTPKQFQRFGCDLTFFQQALSRSCSVLFDEKPIIVTGLEHRGLLLENLLELNIKADIVLEPCSRNSCAAILAGALIAVERDPEAIVLVIASDHYIPDQDAFRFSVSCAANSAHRGEIVTFGIKPQSAGIGYGYILPMPGDKNQTVRPVQRFVEKPDAATAQQYVAEGYLWNSGNLLFRADTFINEARDLAPVIYGAVTQSLKDATRDPDFIRLSETAFSQATSVSVDVAIIEKTKRAAVLPVPYFWSDIGTWDALVATLPKDENGNAIVGQGIILQGQNVTIRSEGTMTTVVGCDDLTVITTLDAVLVVRRGASENVRDIIEELRLKGDEKYL
jgi:mannose-1-phosphate guanylyltransferase / mannose-6-phosphate isomerase